MIEIAPINTIQAALASQAATPASRSLTTSRLTSYSPTSNGATATGSASFAGELRQAVERVEQSFNESNTLTDKLLRGENVEVHTVALRAQEAQMTFDLFLQARNRLIQGYQEIMRLQV